MLRDERGFKIIVFPEKDITRDEEPLANADKQGWLPGLIEHMQPHPVSWLSGDNSYLAYWWLGRWLAWYCFCFFLAHMPKLAWPVPIAGTAQVQMCGAFAFRLRPDPVIQHPFMVFEPSLLAYYCGGEG